MDPSKTVLLIDDHQRFLTALAEGLEACGSSFSILTAENGYRALRLLESAHVDLVVTDLRMPVMNGFDFISHMKKKYPGIPVIVMSSFLDPEVETRLRGLGVSQSIEKSSLRLSTLEEMIGKEIIAK